MDHENQAYDQQMIVPPVLLEMAAKDGKVVNEYARKGAMIGLALLNRKLKDPNLTLPQIVSAVDTLSKIGGIHAIAQNTNVGPVSTMPSIKIVFNSPSPAPQVVDVKATEVAEVTDVPAVENTTDE